MGTTGIRLENCSDVTLNNIVGIGLDDVVSAKDSKNISATNIIGIGESVNFDNLIKEFILQMQGTQFDDIKLRADAIDIALELKKETKDKKKIACFLEKIKSVYKVVDKTTKLANTIITIIEIMKKLDQLGII